MGEGEAGSGSVALDAGSVRVGSSVGVVVRAARMASSDSRSIKVGGDVAEAEESAVAAGEGAAVEAGRESTSSDVDVDAASSASVVATL